MTMASLTTAARAMLFVSVGLTLVQCGDDEATAPQAPAAANQGRPNELKVNPPANATAEAPPVFTYSPVGLVDPFRSYFADIREQQKSESRQLQATEQFELNQYSLTALVTGTSQPKAMVEDPKGVGHVLRVGSRIGKNGGRVTRISSSGVVIIEEFVNPLGKRVRVPITLKLPESDTLTLQAN